MNLTPPPLPRRTPPAQSRPASFEVFKNGRLVLSFDARPGVLMSSAVRAPGFKPPAHPFVNARAHDGRHEATLAASLRLSRSAEEFIRLVRLAGFDVRPLEVTQ